jgi:hypothetical protein
MLCSEKIPLKTEEEIKILFRQTKEKIICHQTYTKRNFSKEKKNESRLKSGYAQKE